MTGLSNYTVMHMAMATRVPGPKTPAHQTIKIRPLDRLTCRMLQALKVWKYFMGKKGTLMIRVLITINF